MEPRDAVMSELRSPPYATAPLCSPAARRHFAGGREVSAIRSKTRSRAAPPRDGHRSQRREREIGAATRRRHQRPQCCRDPSCTLRGTVSRYIEFVGQADNLINLRYMTTQALEGASWSSSPAAPSVSSSARPCSKDGRYSHAGSSAARISLGDAAEKATAKRVVRVRCGAGKAKGSEPHVRRRSGRRRLGRAGARARAPRPRPACRPSA